MSKEYSLKVDLISLMGYVTEGYREVILTEEQLDEFNSLSDEEKRTFLQDYGETVVTDFIVDSNGIENLNNIKIDELD